LLIFYLQVTGEDFVLGMDRGIKEEAKLNEIEENRNQKRKTKVENEVHEEEQQVPSHHKDAFFLFSIPEYRYPDFYRFFCESYVYWTVHYCDS